MYSIKREYLDKYMPKVVGGYYTNFKPYHLDNFNEESIFGVSGVDLDICKAHIIQQSISGPFITAMVNGEPVAVFGAVIFWNGVAEAGALFTEQARRYPLAMTKGAYVFFDICEILFTLHRLQITVRSNDQRAVKWAKRLGFVEEGILKQYSADQQDYYMMRRS